MATTTEEPTEEEAAALAEEAQRIADEHAAAEQENHAALERAVADLPDVPGRDEFLTLCQLARVYSQSGIVPRALKGKPADVLVVLMTGRDLGIPLTAALRKVYVIEGQPSIAPQLKLSLIRKKGLGNVIPHPDNDKLWDRQGAIPLGPGGQVITDAEGNIVGWTGALGPPFWFTWAEDAVIGGYVREGCTPTHHTDECNKARANSNVPQHNGRTANYCKDNYRKNPRRMLWQRASGFVADDHFSEATLGLYDPDELGGMLDEDGQLIDVNHVEVPDGFAAGGGTGGAGQGEELTPVDLAEAWAVQLRVFSMPEDAQAEFRERWMKSKKVPGGLCDRWDDDGQLKVKRFPQQKLAVVESMLRGVEQDWRAQGKYDPANGPAAFSENVLGPSLLWWLTLPYGRFSMRAAAQGTTGAAEPDRAADGAPGPEHAGDATEAPNGGGVAAGDGALPLEVPSVDPTDALLGITDEVRAASDEVKVEWVIGQVKAMGLGLVDEVLRRRYDAPDRGVPDERRSRLAQLVAKELDVEGVPDWTPPRNRKR